MSSMSGTTTTPTVPLRRSRAAEDAMVVDTSALDFDASREALLALIREKLQ